VKVVILCGGLGTRIREETEFRPKPMVNIGGRPILWHIMKIFAHYGHNDFVLCLGYKGGMIKDYFYHYEMLNNDFTVELGNLREVTIHQGHAEAGWKVTMADTGEKALKGARLKKIERYIDTDPFIVTYGDSLADVDIENLLDFHSDHGKLATVTGINPTSRFGELKIEGDKVESFREKPQNSAEFINGGFFVFRKEIFEYLSAEDQCDLEVGALERMAGDGELMVYKHKGSWACMDTVRDMDYLNDLWAANRAFWKIWS
jgi:glucose-1-phosphate cytidylyltransferase